MDLVQYDEDEAIELQAAFVMSRVADMAAEFQGENLHQPVLAWTCVVEESNEVLEAAGEFIQSENVETMAHLLKELADLLYVSAWATVAGEMPEGVDVPLGDIGAVHAAFAIARMSSYFADHELMLEVVERVHASNLSKLGPNGEWLFREDGKRLKGPNYAPPVLTDLAEKALAMMFMARAANDYVAHGDQGDVDLEEVAA